MTVDALVVLAPHATLTTSIVRFEGRDLTQRQMAALYALYLHPGRHTVTSMAAHLHTSCPAVTRIMDRLTDEGLAARDTDPADRRTVLLLPTEAGTAYMQRLAALVREPAGMTVDALAVLAPYAMLTTGIVRFAGRDLTQRQMAVLYALYLRPGRHTVTSMAKQLGTLRTTATRATDRLAEPKLLRRDQDPNDRRVTLVLPTEAGTAYMRRLAALVVRANGPLMCEAAA